MLIHWMRLLRRHSASYLLCENFVYVLKECFGGQWRREEGNKTEVAKLHNLVKRWLGCYKSCLNTKYETYESFPLPTMALLPVVSFHTTVESAHLAHHDIIDERGHCKNKEMTKNTDGSSNSTPETPLPLKRRKPRYSTNVAIRYSKTVHSRKASLLPPIYANNIMIGLSQQHPTALHRKTHQKKAICYPIRKPGDSFPTLKQKQMELRSHASYRQSYLNNPICANNLILSDVNCSIRHCIEKTTELIGISSPPPQFDGFEKPKAIWSPRKTALKSLLQCFLRASMWASQHHSLPSSTPTNLGVQFQYPS